jgi:hypothetical protein
LSILRTEVEDQDLFCHIAAKLMFFKRYLNVSVGNLDRVLVV